jgi:methenyltetrahydromethanopterin cyclohydrolase
MRTHISLNNETTALVDQLIRHADRYRVGVEHLAGGATIIDAGIEYPGSLEVGRLVGEICMGGLGTVQLMHTSVAPNWPLSVHVHSTHPVLACLASQYAGWSLSHGEGKDAFFALGSGPGRAAALKEPLFEELGYQDRVGVAYFVLEVDKKPPIELIEKIATTCHTTVDKIYIILTPTSSLAGNVQVVSRVLETALHKAHELEFPLDRIMDGSASAPVSPPHPDFIKAMGRTNDAILFAGRVHLLVSGPDDDAQQLAKNLPSSASKDYGKPFAKIFKDCGYDFYKVDPMLFSPAKVSVTAIESGHTYHAGDIDLPLLDESFGG